MSKIINIYESDADADDFDSEGLGTLCPLEWEYVNKGIGGAILTITHPYDDGGKWQLIQAGRIIRADVPVRTVPEIENGALIATAEQWTVAPAATKNQRRMYSKAAGGKKKKVVPNNYRVTVVSKGESRYKIKTSKYGTGWIDHDALDVKIVDVPYNTVAAVEAATPSVQVRAQLFRLQHPKVDRDAKTITVEALPIAYDAAGVLTDPYTGDPLTGPQALARIISRAYMDTDLELYTDIGDSRTGFDKRNVGMIDAIMNGDDSFVGRWGGDVLIDDWTVTVLRSAGIDRGFYATYGRNLTGIDSYEISDDVVTAIVPVGENANGTPLYLDGSPYVESVNYSQFPVPHMTELKVSEAKVDKKGQVTVAKARQAMRAAVAAEWEKGVHIPAITLRIEFARLGDTEEYKRFKDLDQCHMYDTVHVWHPTACGYVDMAVCEITWDGMRERYTETVLGTPGKTDGRARISAGSISGSISGRQIAWNAVGSGQLREDCIDARHIQAYSVNAEAIQAETFTSDTAIVRALNAQSIAAQTAAIQTIAAQSITTNELDAAYADIFALVAQQISGTTVAADTLEAAIANLVSVTGTSASFGIEDVQHLIGKVIQATVLTSGLARIENLYVTQANLMNATLDRLTLLAADGETYYDVSVGTDGNLIATERDPSSVDTSTGTTSDGRNVLDASEMETDTGLDVPDLDGLTAMLAEDGLLWVYTQGLSTGKLRATEAFIGSAQIDSLQTTAVEAVGNSMTFSANQVIQMLVGVKDQIRTWFTFGDDGLRTRKMTVDPDTGVVTPASKWSTYIDNEGFYIDHDDVLGHVGAFFREQAIFRSLQVTKTAQDEMNTAIRVRPTSKGGWVWTD